MWYWCAKEAANWLLLEDVNWRKNKQTTKINDYEMKYWPDIAVLSDIRRINKFKILEYALKMCMKMKVEIYVFE